MCIQYRVIALSILASPDSVCRPKLLTFTKDSTSECRSIKYKAGKPRFTCGFHVIENFADGSWRYQVVSGNRTTAAG